MIVRYYKGNLSLDKLATLCKITKQGTSAFHLIEAAKKVGLDAKGLHCDIENLTHTQINLPIIAHVTFKNGYQHFVVVYEINYIKEYLLIADPADKIKKISFQDFASIFNQTIVIFSPKQVIQEPCLSFQTLIKECIQKYRSDFGLFLIFSFFYTVLSIVTVFYIDFFLSSLHKEVEKTYLIFLSLLFLFFHIYKNLFHFFRQNILFYLNQKIAFLLTTETFYSIVSLPYSYFANRNVGEITSRMQDIYHIKDLIGHILTFLCIDSPLMIASLFCLYLLHPYFCLLALFFLGILLFLIYYGYKGIQSYIPDFQTKKAEESTIMIEALVGYETIQSLHLASNRVERYKQKYMESVSLLANINAWVQKIFCSKEMIDSLSYIFLLTGGAFLVLDYKLSLGKLLIAPFFLSYFLNPLGTILTNLSSYGEARSALERVCSLFTKMKEKGCIHSKVKGMISCEKLHYTYDDKTFIFKNLSFQIPKGNKVMLLGQSGIGKSTLLKILKGYYPIQGSHLFIGGTDITLYSKEAIHRDIGYLSQNEILFTDTLYNNITLYRSIPEKNLLKVMQICELETLLAKAPLGMHTMIEENGRNLSGGERQKIILARFLLFPFEIFLIDEGMNQMDLGLERKILKNIFKAFPGKTILFVSHRVDNLDLFDQALRFEEDYRLTSVVRNARGKYVYQ